MRSPRRKRMFSRSWNTNVSWLLNEKMCELFTRNLIFLNEVLVEYECSHNREIQMSRGIQMFFSFNNFCC